MASVILSLPASREPAPGSAGPNMTTGPDIVSRVEPAATGGRGSGRMSRAVGSALLGGVAVSFLAACGDDDEVARCVDRRTDQVVDVRSCDREAADGYGGAYFWLLGGRGSTRIGGRASGGEYIDPADRSSLARRGGFGSSGRSSGTGVRSVAGGGSGGFSSGS